MKKNTIAGTFLGVLVVVLGILMLANSLLFIETSTKPLLLEIPLLPILVIGLGAWVLLNTFGYGCCCNFGKDSS